MTAVAIGDSGLSALQMRIAGLILHFGKREDYPQESWWDMKLGLFEGLEKRYRTTYAKIAKWFLFPGILCFMIGWLFDPVLTI